MQHFTAIPHKNQKTPLSTVQKVARLWNIGDEIHSIAQETGLTIKQIRTIRQNYSQFFKKRGKGKQENTPPLSPPKEIKKEIPPFVGNVLPVITVPFPFSKAVDEKRCLYFAADIMSDAGADMPVCGMIRGDNLKKPYCTQHLIAMQWKK